MMMIWPAEGPAGSAKLSIDLNPSPHRSQLETFSSSHRLVLLSMPSKLVDVRLRWVEELFLP